MNLAQILESVEAEGPGFSLLSAASRFERALKEIGEADHPDKSLLRAECLAFSFSEGGGEAAGWGTYFGPQWAAKLVDGSERQFPPLAVVDAVMLDYWSSRAGSTKNSALRARYADLVWDLSRPATGSRPDVKFARLTIDASRALVKDGMFEYEVEAIQRLTRAFKLAVSIRDAERTRLVIDDLIGFEGKIAVDHLPGLWGFAFDTLLMETREDLPADLEKKLVTDMEARLQRLAAQAPPDPTHVEAATDRLLPYYRKLNQTNDELRVLRARVEAVERFAAEASPLVASSWLDSIHEMLVNRGLHTDADRIALVMRKVQARTSQDLREYSTTVTIPKEELDAQVTAILDGGFDHALGRFARVFVVDRSAIEEQLRKWRRRRHLRA